MLAPFTETACFDVKRITRTVIELSEPINDAKYVSWRKIVDEMNPYMDNPVCFMNFHQGKDCVLTEVSKMIGKYSGFVMKNVGVPASVNATYVSALYVSGNRELDEWSVYADNGKNAASRPILFACTDIEGGNHNDETIEAMIMPIDLLSI